MAVTIGGTAMPQAEPLSPVQTGIWVATQLQREDDHSFTLWVKYDHPCRLEPTEVALR